jgi:hypothetical protein
MFTTRFLECIGKKPMVAVSGAKRRAALIAARIYGYKSQLSPWRPFLARVGFIPLFPAGQPKVAPALGRMSIPVVQPGSASVPGKGFQQVCFFLTTCPLTIARCPTWKL